jgi:hypothetical protein
VDKSGLRLERQRAVEHLRAGRRNISRRIRPLAGRIGGQRVKKLSIIATVCC